ncbi:GIY-YIG nuclease family protein [Polynucleobacter sp. AP-Capit-er-40B-B4]|uniref:GIY-YIG nuclease family protein n=1 Tax=Polynucleobacter sp. AP-Capit-er-40B-B4 TaxID=2576927 RepID=UPI001C0B5A09|nr:GIY-YIG nuclease family protein [Polynucleobacter sp. AP-Capit-er-40B-B4]MBU3580435.1 GIY-YIG nuclease family protein [Polynucleobacter sp. AP-Capit-er-40B-B4]
MNTPYYLMTQQDKYYLRLGALAARKISKNRLMDFSLPEIKGAGIIRPDHRQLYLLGRDLQPIAAIYFLFNSQGHIYYIGQSVNVFNRICGEHIKTMDDKWIKLSVLALQPEATEEQLNYAEAMFIYIHQHKRSRNKHGKIMADMSFIEMLHRFRANFEESLFPITLINVEEYIEYWKKHEDIFQI